MMSQIFKSKNNEFLFLDFGFVLAFVLCVKINLPGFRVTADPTGSSGFRKLFVLGLIITFEDCGARGDVII